MECFERLADMERRIKCKLDRIRHLQDLRGRITTQLSLDKAFSSGDQDKLGSLTAQILDMEKERIDEVVKMEQERDQIEKIIQEFCFGVEYEIMFKRYVLGKSYSRIGREMGYSKSRVYQLHDETLQKLKEKTERYWTKSDESGQK